MAEMTELEEQQIREYVVSQTPQGPGDEVIVVQKVGRRRVARQKYDLYDIRISNGKRWWVITNMTNLYSQDDFISLDQVFTYHLGMNAVLYEQFNVQPDEEQAEHVGKPWRRHAGAVEAMATAEESEDFQAVGIRCRESLLALVRENIDAPWVRGRSSISGHYCEHARQIRRVQGTTQGRRNSAMEVELEWKEYASSCRAIAKSGPRLPVRASFLCMVRADARISGSILWRTLADTRRRRILSSRLSARH